MQVLYESIDKSYERLTVAPIARRDARALVIKNHYMKTFAQGAALCFGVFDGDYAVGVCVFGYSSSTPAKVKNLLEIEIDSSKYIEMQRFWISDKYGMNSESFVLAKIMKLLKHSAGLDLVITHAGGCKNDCGIVYQASGWQYFGKDKCNDFYLTAKGQYKNIIAAMRFGRVKTKGKTPQQIGFELFGEGEIIDSWRYLYAYPIHKGMRRRLSCKTEPFPKDSAIFRRSQKWVEKNIGEGEGRSV